jgi:hypothetical protein
MRSGVESTLEGSGVIGRCVTGRPEVPHVLRVGSRLRKIGGARDRRQADHAHYAGYRSSGEESASRKHCFMGIHFHSSCVSAEVVGSLIPTREAGGTEDCCFRGYI